MARKFTLLFLSALVPAVPMSANSQDSGWSWYPYHRVNALLEDHTGGIWVATDSGLMVLEGETWRTDCIPDSILPGAVFALIEDSARAIWAGGVGNLAVSAVGASSWVETAFIPGGDVHSLMADSRGRVWVGVRGRGLWVYDGANWAQLDVGLPDPNSIREDKARNIWVCDTWGGLAKFDGTDWRTGINVSDSLFPRTAYTSVFALSEDRLGRVWFIAMGSGAIGYDGVHWVKLDSLYPGIPGDPVQFLHQNNEGDVWACIVQDGSTRLARYEGNTWSLIGPSVVRYNGWWVVFLEDRTGRIWVETERGLASYCSSAAQAVRRQAQRAASGCASRRTPALHIFDIRGRSMGARVLAGQRHAGVLLVMPQGGVQVRKVSGIAE